jgi:hypothetical protein
MTYPTLMVHLELGGSNAARLRIAGDLAERFQAGVIGIAACQPIRNTYSNWGDCYISGEIVQEDREEIEKEMKAGEAEFRAALQSRAGTIEWRSRVMFGSLSDYVASQARSADLIVTGVAPKAMFDESRRVNTADLVMQAGRPVLIAPAAANTLKLDRVIVGWKDTREARRAALDALPLLKKGGHVTVVEIAAEEDLAEVRKHLDDVVSWLKRNGVAAVSIAAPSTGADATGLREFAANRRQISSSRAPMATAACASGRLAA